MSAVTSLVETRRLGAPVVRLFRIALGRDPDPIALQDYAFRLGQGASMQDLARDIVRSGEFSRRETCEAASDAASAARLAANAMPAVAPREAAEAAMLAAAQLGVDRPGLIAVLADSPIGRDNIPLLPGLAPGAPPDDRLAYRLWVQEYDSPGETELAAIPRIDG
jgi:hypothetical protein